MQVVANTWPKVIGAIWKESDPSGILPHLSATANSGWRLHIFYEPYPKFPILTDAKESDFNAWFMKAWADQKKLDFDYANVPIGEFDPLYDKEETLLEFAVYWDRKIRVENLFKDLPLQIIPNLTDKQRRLLGHQFATGLAGIQAQYSRLIGSHIDRMLRRYEREHLS